MRHFLAACVFCFLLSARVGAVGGLASWMELPADVRKWFDNPDGSCVQCSNGMVGAHNALPEWTYLLWDTEYGRAVRGGSWPSRVADYMRRRGMNGFNVTGKNFADTRPWLIHAARTRRFAAIGAGRAHFQTLYGYVEGDSKPWKVCNNNSTWKVDEYTEDGFRRLHESSGAWVIVPDEPAPPPAPAFQLR